jgi:metal-responsive CopG/Arc/MetJ family transcriptional regulator
MEINAMPKKKMAKSGEDEANMNRVVFMCPNDLFWAIDVRSDKTGATRSEIIRRALKDYFRRVQQ